MYLGATKHLNVLGRTDALLITITQCTYLYTMEVAAFHYLGVLDVVGAVDRLLSYCAMLASLARDNTLLKTLVLSGNVVKI